MINVFIAVLVHKEILTEAEGKELAKKIAFAVLPHEYNLAFDMVKTFLEEIEQAK